MLSACLLLLSFLTQPPLPVLRLQPLARQAALGKLLFFDPALSANYRRSCASCHRPQKAFTDQRTVARGFSFAENLAQNTPTILNASHQKRFFHDGRANSLSAVIGSVVQHPQEFNSSYDQLVVRLQSSTEYRQLFAEAFPVVRNQPAIRRTTIDRALIAYLQQQTTRQNLGLPTRANLTARSDWQLFMTKLGCGQCHRPPFFRDGRQHQITPGQWRQTPGLVNAALTYPYLADGSAPTLADVLAQPLHRRRLPRPVTLAEVSGLVRFLHSLTDTVSVDLTEPLALPVLTTAPRRAVGGLY